MNFLTKNLRSPILTGFADIKVGRTNTTKKTVVVHIFR